MNNPNAPPAPQGIPSLSNLVKPDHISKLTYLNEHTRVQYDNGVKKLWEQINTQPQNSEPYQMAFRKLVDVTNQVKSLMKKYQPHAAQSDGARPAGQGQQDPRQYAQVNPTGPHPQVVEPQFSQKVLQQVRAQQFRVPPNVYVHGPERTAKWLQDAKIKYATNLQHYETATLKLRELGHDYTARRSSGEKFTPEEATAFSSRKSQLDRSIQEAKEYIKAWHSTQDQLLASNPGASNYSENQALGTEQSHGPPSTQPTSTPDVQGQPHTVNSAVEAARSHTAPQGGRPPSSTSNPAQPGHSNTDKGEHSQHPGTHDQQLNSHTTPVIGSSTSSQSQPHNTQPSSTPQSSTLQNVRPLSHKAAMAEAAHSYTQPNYQQSTSQSSAHGHPHIGGNQEQPRTGSSQQPSTNFKMPIPKDLKVTPPQPVPMGPARPTLSGGPTNGAMGPMGQPAIQKHPGYVLEGDGERVLSKKKLEELVRQVTGGSGGESDEGETLSAEVEETLLQVADDFVDQVIVSACRLAKLRQSSSLELRDIQLILERNYNIRVPGYASDELRTVRKIQPAQGWTQKLSAVQAAKLTGGKTDS